MHFAFELQTILQFCYGKMLYLKYSTLHISEIALKGLKQLFKILLVFSSKCVVIRPSVRGSVTFLVVAFLNALWKL